MTKHIFSRAAQRADQILFAIADKFNGNAARRRAIKQRLAVAMMQTERHSIVAARTHATRLHGPWRGNSVLHYRTQYYLSSV